MMGTEEYILQQVIMIHDLMRYMFLADEPGTAMDAIFRKGFFTQCGFELVGLVIRIVRLISSNRRQAEADL